MASGHKRVIMVVSSDLAADKRVDKMASTLVRAGCRVRVVGRRLAHSPAMPATAYQVTRLRLWFNTRAWFYAEMNIRYFLLLLFARCDIVAANDLDTLPAAYAAARLRGKRLVYDSHEYFTEVPELAGRPRVRAVWQAIERRIFPRLDRCITVCESIAREYSSQYGVPVAVVRNVPMRLHEVPASARIALPGGKVVLYQGTLNVNRGLELLIEAMAFVPDACLLIVGYGPVQTELQRLAEARGVQRRVVFAGRVAMEDLPSYTRLATVGVSLEDDVCCNCRYALPNKLFDYIQSGVPVLVSDLPEMAKVVHTYGCGEVVAVREPRALAAQITGMLGNAEGLAAYRQKCLLAADELCWERQERTILDVYGI